MRLAVQAGLLAGLGWAFAAADPAPAQAFGGCPVEDECTLKKPNVMFVLDYSSSMNVDFGGQTRWEAAVAAIGWIVDGQNGYFDANMHFALLRYGHDPDPMRPGTMIPGADLVDGVALDVAWYDANGGLDAPYFECNGQAIVDALSSLPPPVCNGNPCSGIGSWTEGGLLLAQATIIQSQLDHPSDVGAAPRYYANIVITDSAWVEQDGLGMNPSYDPSDVAADMVASQGADTYVIGFGYAPPELSDELAMAGNTGSALKPANPVELADAVQTALQNVADVAASVPECTTGGSSDEGSSATDPGGTADSGSTSGVDDAGTSNGSSDVDDGESTDPDGESGPPPDTSATSTSGSGGTSTSATVATAGDDSGTGDGSQDTVGTLDRGCACRGGGSPTGALGWLLAMLVLGARRCRAHDACALAA